MINIKKSIYCLFIMCIFICPIIFKNNVSANEPDRDKLFQDTFNSVKKVINIATTNGVKPYYFKCEDSLDPGISTTEDTVKAVESGMQISIYESRELINKLPKELLNYKETFSSILDNYQHPVFERTVSIIDGNTTNPNQSEIIYARIIIDNLIPEYKSSYSSALDNLQNQIFIETERLVEIAEINKLELSFNKAKAAIDDIKSIPEKFKSQDIDNFIKSLEDRLAPLDVKSNINKIINMPSIKINPENLEVKLPTSLPEGYSAYLTFSWIKEYCNNKPYISDLEKSYLSTKLIGDGTKDTINIPLYHNKITDTTLPIQGDYLLYIVNNSTTVVEYISKNPIRLDLGITSTTLPSTNPKESTVKITDTSKYTGYITHEITLKNNNKHIKHDVLITAGDTQKDIAQKLQKSFESISSKYFPNISSSVKEDEFTISSLEDVEINHKIY